MKQLNYDLGKRGEEIALSHLLQKGYKLLAKNFHTRFGEVDLIFTKNNILIFVEVKLKVGEDFGTPEEMITPSKISQVQKTAEMFLLQNPQISQKYPSYRLDAVTIVLEEDRSIRRVNHYENIGF